MRTITRIRFYSPIAVAGILFLAAGAQLQTQDENRADTNTPGTTNAPAEEQSPVIQKGPIVVFGRSVELDTNESAETVVVIGGSAKVHGDVREAVVAIGGDVEVDGNVGQAAVAVLGNVTLGPNAHVHEDVVAVGGKVDLGKGARVNGNVVSVGGRVTLAQGASVRGQVQEVDVGVPGLPRLEGLAKWVRYCVMEFRPLAPQVGWIWVVAGIFCLIYFLVALAFPRPVQACVNEISARPATTFLIGLLTKLLVPVVILILMLTGIGLLVVPFLLAALFFAAIFGKVALLEYMGGGLARPFGSPALQQPLVAFLLGTILLTLLYLVPILGFVVYCVFAIWGLGVAITTAFRRMRRETPRPVVPPAAAPVVPPATAAAFTAVPPIAASAGGGAGESAPPNTTSTAAPPVYPGVPPTLAYPKAGFWERLCAGFLDMVIVLIVWAIVHRPLLGLLFALAYFTGMWAWKGATVGNIVLRLQVVRYDGSPVTFVVALVRALAAAFSAIVLFLGFFWIAWDPDKQGWHDKIAGTMVVRLPRSVPLVCI